MERKLWFKIFVLLLVALSALATHGNETSSPSSVATEIKASPSSALAPATPTAGSESAPSLDGQVNVSNNNTETSSSSSLNSTIDEEPLKTSNETTVTNSSEILDINGTITENGTSLSASQNQTSPTQSQPATTATTLSSINKALTSAVPAPTSASHLEITNASQSNASVLADAVTPTAKLIPSTSTPAASTSTTTTTTTTTTSPTSTAQESIQAAGAVSHKAIPSPLNVGEDTTVVHEAPTLDPLLAGLVSAFIIAAVIITLLLFLKLRRRDSRPEFRRLQDLPMDDMMEDAPLSMYSY